MNNLNLLYLLFTAHILTDFFLQPTSCVIDKNKRKIHSPFLYVHAFCAGLLSYVAFALCGIFSNWFIPVIITITHFAIDLGKTYYKRNNTKTFLLDQLLHALVIVICWLFYTRQWDVSISKAISFFQNENTLLVIAAYLFITMPVSIFIGSVVRRWENAIKSSNNPGSRYGLEKAGQWIGYLERILILTFILIHYYEGIGFLFAAKSIFRFGELTKTKERALTEYILIGTLLSFVMAIGTGVLLNMIM